ncbi:MAG TPA: NAD(P)-dependent oxidoreductase [Hyphomicrobiaceae bacterium]|nr:NAD(P)-dependent oxidoreductase [Hyphomicrobiaceae bacterium]
MAKVAWIGLGVMGYPMAGHIRKKGGHDLTVYNRNAAKAEAWSKEYGGKTAPTPAAAARDADLVFCCVGNDNDLRAVTLGPNGAFDGVRKGAVFIDNTTASANIARELYAAAKQRNFAFLDAPVSGGQAGAQNGVLTVMIGGDQAAFDQAKPVIDCYARMATLIGPAGAGQLTKMVNQIIVAVTVQGVSEGLAFAQRAGLDIPKVMDTISKGAAQSWQMDNRWKTMNDDKFDFGFAVDWMRKDLGIIMDEAKRNGSIIEIAKIIDGYYAEVQQMGGNRWDTSALIARLNKR